jgi:hypothetical protein
MDYWLEQWNANNKLPVLREKEYSSKQLKLDDFSRPFITVALLHELTHVSQIFGSPRARESPT